MCLVNGVLETQANIKIPGYWVCVSLLDKLLPLSLPEVEALLVNKPRDRCALMGSHIEIN